MFTFQIILLLEDGLKLQIITNESGALAKTHDRLTSLGAFGEPSVTEPRRTVRNGRAARGGIKAATLSHGSCGIEAAVETCGRPTPTRHLSPRPYGDALTGRMALRNLSTGRTSPQLSEPSHTHSWRRSAGRSARPWGSCAAAAGTRR